VYTYETTWEIDGSGVVKRELYRLISALVVVVTFSGTFFDLRLNSSSVFGVCDSTAVILVGCGC
jgi:hypothetical protein